MDLRADRCVVEFVGLLLLTNYNTNNWSCHEITRLQSHVLIPVDLDLLMIALSSDWSLRMLPDERLWLRRVRDGKCKGDCWCVREAREGMVYFRRLCSFIVFYAYVFCECCCRIISLNWQLLSWIMRFCTKWKCGLIYILKTSSPLPTCTFQVQRLGNRGHFTRSGTQDWFRCDTLAATAVTFMLGGGGVYLLLVQDYAEVNIQHAIKIVTPAMVTALRAECLQLIHDIARRT